MVSEQEAYAKMMHWRSKPLVSIRAELVRVNGKNSRLCNEAARRLEELSNQLNVAREEREYWRRVAESLEIKLQQGIAAAPDLLEALVYMRRTMYSDTSEESKKADAAIAKALGKVV